ncbi:MAG: hypothetical protein WBX25_06350 [Rhodomicrobium sp.]
MAAKSPVTASEEETVLKALANGVKRAEADGARAILLTLMGWTSARIAQAFGVREDTVRSHGVHPFGHVNRQRCHDHGFTNTGYRR